SRRPKMEKKMLSHLLVARAALGHSVPNLNAHAEMNCRIENFAKTFFTDLEHFVAWVSGKQR
ncbi:MAG: hypothetical protein AAGF59_15525, partial [Pseudomonadota bacterium]